MFSADLRPLSVFFLAFKLLGSRLRGNDNVFLHRGSQRVTTAQDPRRFVEAAHAALNDPQLKPALGRLKTHFGRVRTIAVARYGDFEALREQGRAIRDYALSHLDELLETLERNVQGRGGQVHWARDAAEARTIILGILRARGAATVTKGKSMVSEEVALNPFLQANGIRPVETDLGEYIVQLRDEPPSHIIAPAFHLNKEQVAETFHKSHPQLDPQRSLAERSQLVAEARQILREQFEAADAGITGANFLSAAEGAAVLVTNEGNGDLTRLLPKTHIVLTGIEKVVPDLDDVAVLLRLLTRSATGQDISSYVTIMNGPRAANESDGPEEFHIVLLDNGRTKLLGTEAEDVLRCIRCGACLNHCPIYGAVGGHAYGATYSGPIGAALNPALMGVGAAHHHPNASTFCGRCADICPVKIPLPKIMRYWRAQEYAQRLAPKSTVFGLTLWAFAAKRPWLYRIGTRVAARMLRQRARNDGFVHALPIMRGWFAVRDLPAPEGKTFHDQWRASR
jgi:L-lactate dehydrogenase complex protein LldF